jgi:hypothetical protein
MGILSSLFGKRTDKVGDQIRENSAIVDSIMKECHSEPAEYDDFVFEYLYTNSEPISDDAEYGSVIYIRVTSPVHEHVSNLPTDFRAIQEAINDHQSDFADLPEGVLREKTRWLYFNMMKVFRAA